MTQIVRIIRRILRNVSEHSAHGLQMTLFYLKSIVHKMAKEALPVKEAEKSIAK